MLDIGWTEMLMIAVIAIVVIGPRDLPKMLKTVGGWVRKARSTVRELQTGIEDMAREAELDEVKKSVESATRVDNWLDDKAVVKPPASPSPPAATSPQPSGAASAGAAADAGKPAKLW